MSGAMSTHATLGEWVAHAAVPFALDSPDSFSAAVETLITALGDSLELLGFGEALLGGEELLILRNRLFQLLRRRFGPESFADFDWLALLRSTTYSRGGPPLPAGDAVTQQ